MDFQAMIQDWACLPQRPQLPKGFVTRYVVDGDDASPRGPPPPLSDDEDLGVAQPELPIPATAPGAKLSKNSTPSPILPSPLGV